jgi:hypothetical protein
MRSDSGFDLVVCGLAMSELVVFHGPLYSEYFVCVPSGRLFSKRVCPRAACDLLIMIL